MNSEYVALTIIAVTGIFVALAYQLPAKVLKVNKQGSSANDIQNIVKSVKESIESIATSSPILFGKSKSSYYSHGGSKRNKKGGKIKTKGQHKR